MRLFILQLPGPGFTGFRGGVDFSRGRGSTSSEEDAYRLALVHGCRVSILEPDGSERPVKIIRHVRKDGIPVCTIEPQPIETALTEGVEASAPSVGISPEALEAERQRSSLAAKQDALERNPDSAWSKKKAAAAEAAAAILAEAGRKKKAVGRRRR